jgi:hypothetical protein
VLIEAEKLEKSHFSRVFSTRRGYAGEISDREIPSYEIRSIGAQFRIPSPRKSISINDFCGGCFCGSRSDLAETVSTAICGANWSRKALRQAAGERKKPGSIQVDLRASGLILMTL